ncbi:glycine betaine ABC transporter substrate-binding protein [Cocleimonas flava]|uniref:Glycine betaine/proline transport system substrate-binding protein n=1 Tax=Cocleimonas flava TaxID=634765 RepID=A0A4R1ETA6_9GAMM|nr:glycine betaine ABC transporter substrate-binding protein [Cocleimonas flava]TCJ83024.1 glycine betaine/proline transport system substrate-binding protein [Cocleimonas flava]
MKSLKKLTLSAILIATTTVGVFAQEVVKVAEPNWASGRAMAGLIKVVIEDKLGGKVELVPGTNAVIFKAMDRGKGEIDVHPDVWLPNQANFTDEYVDQNKTVVLSENGYEGFSAFCAPREFATKNKIKTVFDLATPEIAKLMDRDGDGMGDIWIGAPGWASTKINAVKVRDYGITNFYKPSEVEEEVATASIANALKKGEGYVFYCYAPHYNWFVFDMVRLEEPAYDPEKYDMKQPAEDPKWFENSKVETGDKPKDIHVAYSKTLESRTPSIARFLKKIKVDTDLVNRFTNEIVVKKRPSEEVAREWIAANSDRVDGWLGLK